MRKVIGPPLDIAGRQLARTGVSADSVTVTGFVLGLGAVPLLAGESYVGALVLILINRLFDGIDGAIARESGATDFGGYLDIVCDFIFYAAVVAGFALARPETNALAAIYLIRSFVGTGTTFLAYAILATKYGLSTRARGAKAFYHLGGLMEGTETIAFFVAMCLLPDHFVAVALVFGTLCWVTTTARVLAAWQGLRAAVRGP